MILVVLFAGLVILSFTVQWTFAFLGWIASRILIKAQVYRLTKFGARNERI